MIDNKSFNLYLNDIKDIKVLSVEEEKYLFENFNPENRKKIIESNLKLVVALSREYYNIPFESLTYMDIIEAGNIGLIKAVERFDYKKGYKFSTFASYYIKSQIIKEIYKNNRIIRRPFNQERLISKKLKTIQTVLSLDDSFPNSIDGTEPLLYFIEDEENNIYDEINQIEIKEIIKDILNTLTPRQKEVLLLRFGFDDGNYKTLRKVGSILKISDEGVRKIEQKAFTKIRKNNNLKDIKIIIKDILNKLTPREREIIKLRHGLDDLDEKTFEEIGKIFGITRQRANQIANDVYKKIRKGKNIEDYL